MPILQPPSVRGSRWAHASRGTASVATFLVALLLDLPQLLRAQTVTPPVTPSLTAAALVGKWAAEGEHRVSLTFKADSTFSHKRRWRLIGDTLEIYSALDGPQADPDRRRHVVRLDGQRLTLTALPGPAVEVYVRVASADPNWTSDQPLTGRAWPCDRGQIKDFECHNVELLAYLPKDSLRGAVGTDLWGWHDSATGREFVVTTNEAVGFVEVTDPLHPKFLGILGSNTGLQGGTPNVKVYQHYAIIGHERQTDGMQGIQIFDLTQLRSVTRPTEFQETAHYDGLENTHTLALNQATGFAYANGSNTCGGGLHMIDLRTPTKPVFAGCYPETLGRGHYGYVHDSQCVVYRGPDRRYRGREICVDYAHVGIGLVDVTDKQHPMLISAFTYPNLGYAHQGWFTEDQRYIYMDDEGDEFTGLVHNTRTIGFDLRDLEDPVLLTEFFHSTTVTDHNLYIRGRYMYQGNGVAGLRIIDVAEPKHPKEAGYLTNIGTAWGTYPFLKKDVVAVSTNAGLFLVRLQKR